MIRPTISKLDAVQQRDEADGSANPELRSLTCGRTIEMAVQITATGVYRVA
jgi:hypothetical protein